MQAPISSRRHAAGEHFSLDAYDKLTNRRQRLSPKNTRTWTALSAAATASLGALGTADADVIHIVPTDPITAPLLNYADEDASAGALDIDGDGYADFRFFQTRNPDAVFLEEMDGSDIVTEGDSIDEVVARLARGTPCCKGSTGRDSISNMYAVFGNPGLGGTVTGMWRGNSVGYAALKFHRNSIGGGRQSHYAWLRIETYPRISNPGVYAAILDFAFESEPNTSIHVGQIPEPGAATLSLLALGAMGVTRMRRKQ